MVRQPEMATEIGRFIWEALRGSLWTWEREVLCPSLFLFRVNVPFGRIERFREKLAAKF